MMQLGSARPLYGPMLPKNKMVRSPLVMPKTPLCFSGGRKIGAWHGVVNAKWNDRDGALLAP